MDVNAFEDITGHRRGARSRGRVGCALTGVDAPMVWLASALTSGVAAAVVSGNRFHVALAIVALLSIWAALTDHATRRIPNSLVLASLAAVVGALVVTIGIEGWGSGAAANALAGWVISGAPLLFALWVVRPGWVGGGDWKLLGVQGTAVGLLAPVVAPIVLLGGALGGLVYRVAVGWRHAPLGPGLAAGYLGAIITAMVAGDLFGGAA